MTYARQSKSARLKTRRPAPALDIAAQDKDVVDYVQKVCVGFRDTEDGVAAVTALELAFAPPPEPAVVSACVPPPLLLEKSAEKAVAGILQAMKRQRCEDDGGVGKVPVCASRSPLGFWF